jgi:hypothetical protein
MSQPVLVKTFGTVGIVPQVRVPEATERAIDGRPVFAYSLWNCGCSSLNASSVMTRRGRKGWSWDTRCSGLT